MNKACFALILAFTFASALTPYPDYDAPGHYYRNINRHRYNKHETIDAVCLNAVAGVNTAISQLLFDVKVQNNQWIIYSDLDELDESSYYLTRTCHSRSLELVNQLSDEQAPTQIQSQACAQLIGIIGTMLEQDEDHIFGHNYQRGMELSAAALDAGRAIGNGCDIVLRPAQAQLGDVEGEEDMNEEELSLQEGNDESGEAELYLEEAKMKFNMRMLASHTDDESDDDWESDDDNNNIAKGDTDESDENTSDDSDDKSDAESSDNDDSDEDSDDTDSDSLESFGWDSSKGFRIKVSKSKDGKEEGFIISYNPSTGGFSMKRAASDDEDTNEEEASTEENAEEWNSEEWDNNEQGQDLLALMALFYSYGYDWQGGNHNYNNNGDHEYHGGSRLVMF